ncbi:Auxin-induced protein 22B [Vitis vinifera]|uniref:Auxin-responsive protein n=1 Tax=Vitis vinifera TaxID=29760 RepID=A0A438KLG4_VITVI|nr:Auxin-induced protein 22B [Vitis vinifera]
MEGAVGYESDLNLKATELRLGLPGRDEAEKEALSGVRNNKRASPDTSDECGSKGSSNGDRENAPATNFQPKKTEAEAAGMFVKVSMDGAPYLRKIDLKVYKGYPELLQALQNMFKFTIGDYSEREGYKGSEYVPTYEDKDGDWMLVGDVPWDMFMSSCKRLRIMKGSDARGLGCGA